MKAQPYDQLSELSLLELCVWREARGEGFEGKRAVAWSIKNRTQVSCWWNDHIAGNYHRVILKPWQFSSFNVSDQNSAKWPEDEDPAFAECAAAALPVWMGSDTQDPTNGATNYYDISIDFPHAWGPESDWENTLDVGRLRFWKKRPAPSQFIDLTAGDV